MQGGTRLTPIENELKILNDKKNLHKANSAKTLRYIPVSKNIADQIFQCVMKNSWQTRTYLETPTYVAYLQGLDENNPKTDDANMAVENTVICAVHKKTGEQTEIPLTHILGEKWKIRFNGTSCCTQGDTLYITISYGEFGRMRFRIRDTMCKILAVDLSASEAYFLEPEFQMYEPSRRLDEVHLSITDDQLIVCVYDSGLGEEDLDEDETLQNRAFLIHLDSAEHVFELNPPVEFCDVFAYQHHLLLLGRDGQIYRYDVMAQKCIPYVDFKGHGIDEMEYFPIIYKMLQIERGYLLIARYGDRYQMFRLTKDFEVLYDFSSVFVVNNRIIAIDDEGDYCTIDQYALQTGERIENSALYEFPEESSISENFLLLGDWLYQAIDSTTAYTLSLKSSTTWKHI